MLNAKPWLSLIAQTLGIAACYLLARFFIMGLTPLPQDYTYTDWFRQDLWIYLPRAAALAGYLAVMRRHPTWESWGWHGKAGSPLGQIVLWGMTAGTLGAQSGSLFAINASALQIAVGVAGMALIAAHEEAAFRGLLLRSLDGHFKGGQPVLSAVLSSLIFAVWHLGAQPPSSWPGIFATGMVFCAAAYAGAGLPWLIAAHILVDIPFILTGPFPWGLISESVERAGNNIYLLAFLGAFIVLRLPSKKGAGRPLPRF